MVRAQIWSTQNYLTSLKKHGSTLPAREKMLDFDGLNEVLGTPDILALGERYDSKHFGDKHD